MKGNLLCMCINIYISLRLPASYILNDQNLLDREGSVFFHLPCLLNERFCYCWQLHILSSCGRWRACDNFRLKVVSKNLSAFCIKSWPILDDMLQSDTFKRIMPFFSFFFYRVEEGVELFQKHGLNLLFQMKKELHTSTHLK